MIISRGILRWRCHSIVALISLLCAACTVGEAPTPRSSSSAAPPAYGDTLVAGTIGEASTLIPILASDNASLDVASKIYNGLLRYDKNLKVIGELAENYRVSSDGLTLSFNLRKNVKWHDNAPFTSRDVLYTYRVTIDPNTPTAYAEGFKRITSVTAPDAYTVIVRYDKPYAPALESWMTNICPVTCWKGRRSPKARWPANRLAPGRSVLQSG
jgi:peptide/nickel transport system substrate-binding protein